MSCEGSDCEPPDEKRPTPSPTSGTGSCPHPGYVRRLPRVQYVRDGVVVSNVSLESFRATGGYTLYGLRHRDVNNNYRRVALQFNFWRPVTIAAIRLVHTRVGLLKDGPTGRWVGSRVTRVAPGVVFDTSCGAALSHSWKFRIVLISQRIFYVIYCILPSVLQNSDLLFPRHVLANLCHS